MRQSEVNDSIVPVILVTIDDFSAKSIPLVNEGSMAWQWVGRTFPTDSAVQATLRLGMRRKRSDNMNRAKTQEEDSQTVFFDDISLSVGQ